MGTRMLPGSGEKLRLPSGPTRQDLGSSSSSRDKRDSVPVMVDGLQVLTSLNSTGGRSRGKPVLGAWPPDVPLPRLGRYQGPELDGAGN